MTSTAKRAVFLDRDGTLIKDGPFLSNPDHIEFLDGAIEGLQRLQENKLRLVLITNQSGVGRGYFTEETLAKIHKKFLALLSGHGIALDAIYYCPHAPEAQCDCRKPECALFVKAIREHQIDPASSFAIGDKLEDAMPAKKIGCKTILLAKDLAVDNKAVDYVAPEFRSAVEWIVKQMDSSLQTGSGK